MIRDVYNTDTIFGKSIPATEHSIMTLKGEDGELELMERVLHIQQVLLHVYLILIISLELALNIIKLKELVYLDHLSLVINW
jgi:hypothetical protein